MYGIVDNNDDEIKVELYATQLHEYYNKKLNKNSLVNLVVARVFHILRLQIHLVSQFP